MKMKPKPTQTTDSPAVVQQRLVSLLPAMRWDAPKVITEDIKKQVFDFCDAAAFCGIGIWTWLSIPDDDGMDRQVESGDWVVKTPDGRFHIIEANAEVKCGNADPPI